jgi:hypothetical protein
MSVPRRGPLQDQEVRGLSTAGEWCEKSPLRSQATHVCRIGYNENRLENTGHHTEDEKGVLLEQNVYLKLQRLHFEHGYKRLSSSRFKYWPTMGRKVSELEAHELLILLRGGDPSGVVTAPVWRKV